REAFGDDVLDKEAERVGKKLQKVSVTETLSKDLNECREILTEAFLKWNEKEDPYLIDEGVQKLLNRLIFIRCAEDRKIEPPTLMPLIHEWESSGKAGQVSPYQNMVKKFRELDDIYDSNLFDKHPFEKWEEFGGATEKVIDILYGKKNYFEYDFSVIPADVLGNVYENYLGHQLKKSKKEERLDKNLKKRKEQGIYYTPKFIVDYIVQNALGPVLDKCKSINDLQKVKILDPACGSGSFLVAAMNFLIKKYQEFGTKADGLLKIQILQNNIYGVDLDQQAVELVRLNLLLNTFDSQIKLPGLENNIKNGNSLISGTDEELEKYFGKNYRDKNPFNWQEEFPEVFKQGGFDCIIGNPPWGANIDKDAEYLKKTFPNSTKEKKDTYKTFIDQSLLLLKITGRIGFVVPNSFLYQPSYEDLKDLIAKYQYFVINLGEHIFGNVELPCCILILDKKEAGGSLIIDLTKENRELLPIKILSLDFKNSKKISDKEKKISKNTGLTLEDVFNLKDAGIQYHRSGIGLSNKGGNDLYERIFCNVDDNKFKNGKETFYGKLLFRYYINNTTDEIFNLDYKSVLKGNESVSFSKEAFEQDERILWRQTAATILATLDNEKKWFRNTIQCAWIKKEYKTKVNIFYALAIFNSKYTDYLYRKKVLETGRVFPQVKIKYLRDLPFVVGTKDQQGKITELAKKMLTLNKELRDITENSDQWQKQKDEIAKTNKKIDEEVYKLYGLTEEEVKIVENN
ncbi:MAG: N-6 DNA methylase, partial [Candidatus Falkowbacteria bacterium]|nr:N-6 DNA methylase [Candidatus Falkowbacteria bacterium]